MVFSIHFVLTWAPSSHQEVLDMEIQFFHERVTEKDPKLLINHLQRMASGEAPFFPTALSLVFDKLAETVFPKRIPLGPAPGGGTEGEHLIHPTPPPQASTSTSNIPPPPVVDIVAPPSNSQALASTHQPVPPIATPGTTWLKCRKCGRVSLSQDLRGGLRCPQCPASDKQKRTMLCGSCNALQTTVRANCERKVCRMGFM